MISCSYGYSNSVEPFLILVDTFFRKSLKLKIEKKYNKANIKSDIFQKLSLKHWYQTLVKMDLKVFCPSSDIIYSYLPRLLLSYRTIPPANRLQSLSALLGKQIFPLILSYSINEKMWYKKDKAANPEKANFIM